ncbi:MAG: FG-GAP-like repeat-containing protein [Bacteroidota bacterium]
MTISKGVLLGLCCHCFYLLPCQHLEQLAAPWFQSEPSNSNSCAWGDADNDGDLDLFVTNGEGSQPNEFYENLGDGRMLHRPDLLQKLAPVPSFGAAWGDYDGDGDLDLYVTNVFYQGRDAAANYLYRNDGNLLFTAITDLPITTDLSTSYATAWIDLNNDGHLDLSVFNAYVVRNDLYLNDGAGGFEKIAGGYFSSSPHQTTSGSWADFDNDGDVDCLAIDTWKAGLQVYENLGNNFLRQLLPGEHALAGAEIYQDRSACWADINKDGWQDVLIRRLEKAPLLYINDGAGDFWRDDTTFLVSQDVDHEWSNGQSAIWGDFDADGDMDLQVPINAALAYEFYRNDGTGQLLLETDVTTVDKEVFTYGTAAVDYDLNGDLDYFQCVRYDNSTEKLDNAQNQLFVARESTCNQSLQLELRGSTANAYGVGAKVMLYFTDEQGAVNAQLQEVACLNTGGYSGQNGYRLYFGLGTATEADSLVIQWPGGTRQVIGTIPSGYLYYILEDGGVEVKQPYNHLRITSEVDSQNPCVLKQLRASGQRGNVTWLDKQSGQVVGEGPQLLIDPNFAGRTLQATDFCGRTATFSIPSNGVEMSWGPNPTTGTLFLRFTGLSKQERPFKLSITNALGQHVTTHEWKFVGGYQEEMLDMSRFPAGVYYLHFQLNCQELLEEVVLVRH